MLSCSAVRLTSETRLTTYLILPDGSQRPVHDGMTIGRVNGCDLVLDDAKVSREHARLHVERGVVEVEDLGSSNGTQVNGKKVQRRVLRAGDVLQCGASEMVFQEELEVTQPLAAAAQRALEKGEEESAEVDVIEFVDEVVEVTRRPDPKPESVRPRSTASDRRPDADVTQPIGRGGQRDHGVLRYSANRGRGGAGALGQDVGQLGGWRRLLLWVGLLVLVAALGWLGIWLAGSFS